MESQALSFTVMTCNLGNDRASPERLVAVLREAGADLIGIQELSERQAGAISRHLIEEYPYQAVFPGGFAGKAVLSRFPIVAAEQLHLSTVRPDLHATIDLGSGVLAFLVGHPPPPRPHWSGLRFDRQTWSQITTLAEMALRQTPAILVGDFNLVDWRREYVYLRNTGLKDAFSEAGTARGHTLPRRIGPWKRFLTVNRLLSWLPLPPLLRVDYIWYTEPLECRQAWVGQDTGSDHLPVLAKMAWQPAFVV
jgi:vancomycin resistance protein VanJ